MTVGERIREYRKQAGLTQKELGDRLGVSNVHIGQYERGLRNPKLPQLKKIADALDIPFDLLVSDKVEALVDTSKQIDPSIMNAFTQGEFEEKLSHIGYSLKVESDDTFSCFTKEWREILYHTRRNHHIDRAGRQLSEIPAFRLCEQVKTVKRS